MGGEILSVGTQISMKTPKCKGKFLEKIYLYSICKRE